MHMKPEACSVAQAVPPARPRCQENGHLAAAGGRGRAVRRGRLRRRRRRVLGRRGSLLRLQHSRLRPRLALLVVQGGQLRLHCRQLRLDLSAAAARLPTLDAAAPGCAASFRGPELGHFRDRHGSGRLCQLALSGPTYPGSPLVGCCCGSLICPTSTVTPGWMLKADVPAVLGSSKRRP